MRYRVCFLYVLVFVLVSTTFIFNFSVYNKETRWMETIEYVYQGIMNRSTYAADNETDINNRSNFKIVTVSALKSTETKPSKTSKVSATNVNLVRNASTTKKANTIVKASTTYEASTTKKANPTKKANTTLKANTTKVNPVSKTKQQPKCPSGLLPKIYDGIYPNVTIITAYFNIGKFKKGGGPIFDTPLYTKWSHTYENMQNPLVFYTDSEIFKQMFAKVRSKHLNTTKIVLINRNDLWAFQWMDRIKKIYSMKGYPKHHPNTVVPEYSCVQHAKHNLVEDAILKKYVTTKYVTWLDIGYFRNLLSWPPDKKNNSYWIVKPANFNDSRIAVNEVYGMDMKGQPQSIFKRNMVWIGGGMAFGVCKVYLDFVQDYKRAVERYLNMSLMNTDQQVIYAMNLPEEKKILKSKVDLQLYTAGTKLNCWFYLGFSCYRVQV